MAYATPEEYEAFTGKAAPAGAARLLERASELIESAIVVAFDADDEAAALRDATCAAVEAWVGVNPVTPDRIDFPSGGSVSLGELSIGGGGGGGKDGGGSSVPTLPERARRILHIHGLLYRGVTAR